MSWFCPRAKAESRPLLVFLGVLLLAACQSQPERPASHIVEGAHSGGSFLAISPDSRTLASGGWSGWVKLWQLETGKPLAAWKAHGDSVNGLLFLPDGALVSAGYDGVMAIWGADGTPRKTWRTDPVTAFAGDLATQRILTGHRDGSLRLWDLEGNLVQQWHSLSDVVRSVALDGQGRFAAASEDREVVLWSLSSLPVRLDGPSTWSRTLAFSPDGRWLYGAGWFDLYRWPLRSAENAPGEAAAGALQTLDTDHHGIINSIQFMPDGRLATISRQTDSSVLLIDPATGTTGERLQRHDLCGVAVRVSTDGRFIATTSDDASVRIWDMRR